MYIWNDGTYLEHHGIKGQKWGQRRFQYEDGSLTPAGRQRYSIGIVSNKKSEFPKNSKVDGFDPKNSTMPRKPKILTPSEIEERRKKTDSIANKVISKWDNLSDKQKTALKVGAAVAATALVAYGAYKINDKIFTSKLNEANSLIDEGRRAVNNLYKETKDMSQTIRDDKKMASYTLRAEPYGSKGYNDIVSARDRMANREKTYGDLGWNKTISYIGSDGKMHTASGKVSVDSGDYEYKNSTGDTALLRTRDELKRFNKNRNKGK